MEKIGIKIRFLGLFLCCMLCISPRIFADTEAQPYFSRLIGNSIVNPVIGARLHIPKGWKVLDIQAQPTRFNKVIMSPGTTFRKHIFNLYYYPHFWSSFYENLRLVSLNFSELGNKPDQALTEQQFKQMVVNLLEGAEDAGGKVKCSQQTVLIGGIPFIPATIKMPDKKSGIQHWYIGQRHGYGLIIIAILRKKHDPLRFIQHHLSFTA